MAARQHDQQCHLIIAGDAAEKTDHLIRRWMPLTLNLRGGQSTGQQETYVFSGREKDVAGCTCFHVIVGISPLLSLHHEMRRYHQSTGKVCKTVLWGLIVHGAKGKAVHLDYSSLMPHLKATGPLKHIMLAVMGPTVSLSLSHQSLRRCGLDELAVSLQLENSETHGVCLRAIHPLDGNLETSP